MTTARRPRSTLFPVLSILACSVLLTPTLASAQQPTKSDSMRAQMEQASTMMVPMMGQMMESMMEGMLKVMAKPENAERLATFTRNYYDALVRKGFTKQEALQIVMATGLPRMPSGPR